MGLCFAIMPISVPSDFLERYNKDVEHFRRVAEHIFKPAVEAADMEFLAPSSTSSEIIQAEIIERLETADLVLCDISTYNANVFFELGIRVALDKPVAMVRDEHTGRIPFDTAMLNAHIYRSNLAVWSVKDEIPKLTAHLQSAKTQTQNALWKYFGITQRAERVDAGDPQDAKLELLRADVAELVRVVHANSPRRARPATDYLQTRQESTPEPNNLTLNVDLPSPALTNWILDVGSKHAVVFEGYDKPSQTVLFSSKMDYSLSELSRGAPEELRRVQLLNGRTNEISSIHLR